jgi:F0F1-type ATP synthase alpha subunit
MPSLKKTRRAGQTAFPYGVFLLHSILMIRWVSFRDYIPLKEGKLLTNLIKS